MRMRFPITLGVMIMLLAAGLLALPEMENVQALPEDYPISLSGGYSSEIPDTTTYLDYLQPGDTENYLLKVENTGVLEARYRVILTGVPQGWLVFLENGNLNMPVDLDPFESETLYIYIKNPQVGTADILINVTNENSGEYWTLTLRIICQRGPLVLDVEGINFIVGREVPAEVALHIENIGDTVLNVTLDMHGIVTSTSPIEDTWTVQFSERTFLIPPFAEKEITVFVRCPQFEPIGSQKISEIQAHVVGITRPFSSSSLTFRVQTIFDLRTTVTPIGYQKVNPGTSVEFELSIENWATETDYVLVSEYSIPSGWTLGFNDTIDPTSFAISVDPESTRKFHPVVMVSPFATAGRHDVIMKATGETNETDIYLRVEVARKDAMDAIPLPSTGSDRYRITLGDNSVSFKIKNRGNYYDTLTLEVLNRPAWAPAKFHSVSLGGGSTVTEVSGNTPLNVSESSPGVFRFQEADLETITVSLKWSQEIVVTLMAEVPMDSEPASGVIGINYRYGQFSTQAFVPLPLKLIIVDLEIMDLDGDELPDLDVNPEPDYDLDDKITFHFRIKNNYPFATRDGEVLWRIELTGIVLLKGEVGVIPPGGEKNFTVTWKAEKSTKLRNSAFLRIYGDVYEVEDQAPSAKTDEEIFVRSGDEEHAIGLMVLFGGIMVAVIIVFISLFILGQRNVKAREDRAKREYETVYGRRGPELRGRRPGELPGARSRRSRELGAGERPGLPSKGLSSEGEEAASSRSRSPPLGGEGKKGKKSKRLEEPRKKDAGSGPGRPPPSTGEEDEVRKAPKLKEYEVPDPLEDH